MYEKLINPRETPERYNECRPVNIEILKSLRFSTVSGFFVFDTYKFGQDIGPKSVRVDRSVNGAPTGMVWGNPRYDLMGQERTRPETACVHVASRAVPRRTASLQRRPKPKVRITECWILGGPWSNTCTKCIK